MQDLRCFAIEKVFYCSKDINYVDVLLYRFLVLNRQDYFRIDSVVIPVIYFVEVTN